MISIPNSFQLGGRHWEVVYHDLIDNEPETLGDCDSDQATIRLKSGLKPELLQHTYYHELMHAVCFTLGWDKLNDDEGKIDALGGMILQYLRSKRGRI